MTDKVQKIREELARLKEETSIGLSEYDAGFENGRMEIINAISILIDSMQEESVSEELEKAANQIVNKAIPPLAQKYEDGNYVGGIRDYFDRKEFIDLVKAGANWQKQQMIAKTINTKASLIMSVPSICISLPLGVNVGDKVKVIVIKED